MWVGYYIGVLFFGNSHVPTPKSSTKWLGPCAPWGQKKYGFC